MPARKTSPPKSSKKRPVRGAGKPQNGHGSSWMELDEPTLRPLKVYALDPSAGNYIGNVMTINVRWEKNLQPGPVGSKVAVVDYDGANKCYYPPVDLNDHRILARGGLDPSESDPRFHQQMVYAVATETIEKFETALGRRIHWRRADRPPGNGRNNTWRKTDDIWVLNLFPHAMIQANAFYSPEAKGILFGYFKAQMTNQGHNLPGQRVFTCLSHDIVAHEVTHAVIDGIRSYFTEPTNPDVLAFHEGFADLAALFSHFSHKEALIDTIQKTGGRLYQFELKPDVAPPDRRNEGTRANGGTRTNGGDGKPTLAGQTPALNPLIQLAQQFGEASGMNRGLRSALGVAPNSDDINKNVNDAHFRGSILVAAVFDAYFSVYIKRTADLFRIFRAGGGSSNPEELPGPLADLLSQQASATASEFFQLCARALEYCAPVDITFGDFLRALITVNFDMNPDGGSDVRDAIMQAFRVRGIYPDDASFFSEDALRWPRVPPWPKPPEPPSEEALPPVTADITNPKTGKVETMSLIFGSPNGQTKEEKNINGAILRKYAQVNAEKLGFDANPKLEPEFKPYAPSFHPVFRIGADGSLRTDMVVDLVQTKRVHFDPHVPRAGSFPMRGGVTLIISEPVVDPFGNAGAPQVRYAIRKVLTGSQGERRQRRQAQYMMSIGMVDGKTDDPKHFQVNFGLLHQGF